MNRQGRRTGIAVLLAGMVVFGAGSTVQPAAAGVRGGHVGPQLVGADWRVTRVVEPSGTWSPGAKTRTRLRFDGKGGFTARVCNHYRGDVRITEHELHVGQVQGTLMACMGEESGVEDVFRHVMRETVAWSITSGELVLSRPDGHALHLRPSASG